MKCEICGGELFFQDGIYICESCGAKSESSVNIEAFDVFLMYNEFDEQGRRSKSSIIAQEIYNKLTQKNVSVFYEKNYDSVFGDERIKLKDFALYKTDKVIMIGTKETDFKELSEDKYIIPVCADVDIKKLPEEIQKLQVLNYNDIGAVEDLLKVVLNLLGRQEDDVDFISVAEKKKKVRKKRITISLIVTVAIIVLASLCFVFFTPYVLPNNQYLHAQELVENKQYLEAIDWFNKNPDYKNTNELLKALYNEYDGTYITPDKKTMLQLNILNSTSVDVSFFQNNEKGKIKLSSNTTVNQKIIEFKFKDNNALLGTGKIELLNDGVKVSLDYTDKNEYDLEQKFTFGDKGDAGEYDSGLRAELLGLFNPEIYPIDYGVPFVNKDKLLELGFKLDADVSDKISGFYYATSNNYDSESIEVFKTGFRSEWYRADYEYLKVYHPAAYYSYQMDTENNIIFEFDASGNYENNYNVISIFGKASLLTPDKVGEKPEDFTENDVVFSFVNAKDVVGKDDWVNITYINKNHLKEYNARMNAVEEINNTNFKKLSSVEKLDGENYTFNDFMISDRKLEFLQFVPYYSNNGTDTMQFAISGTDYYIAFYYDIDETNDEGYDDDERCVIYTELSEEYIDCGLIVPIRELEKYDKVPVTENETEQDIIEEPQYEVMDDEPLYEVVEDEPSFD